MGHFWTHWHILGQYMGTLHNMHMSTYIYIYNIVQNDYQTSNECWSVGHGCPKFWSGLWGFSYLNPNPRS